MESSFSLDDSAPSKQSGLGGANLGESSGEVAASPPLFTSVIADSLVSGVGLLVVVPLVVGVVAALLAVLMFRSGRFDGETIMPYIIVVAVSGVVAVIAVVVIYMISNVFVPVT